MTPKQERFVAEYLIDLNATQAAIRAGYSAKTAYSIGQENLTKPEIAAALEKAQEKRAERTELSQDWVLDRLREIAERTMQAEAVKDSQGETTGEYRFDASGANRSLELIGKHLGMFVERVKLQVSNHEDALSELK